VVAVLLQTPKVTARQEKVSSLRAESSGSSGIKVIWSSLSLKIVVDSGDLAIGLLCQITIRQNVAAVVIKKGVGVSIARVRSVVRLRCVIHRLRGSVATEVDWSRSAGFVGKSFGMLLEARAVAKRGRRVRAI
jgi:hypothetical protein